MKSHAEKGYRIVNVSNELKHIAEYVLHHHESWDGSGYPDGLKQESIPLLSRIIAIVDSYDALTNNRPYRRAMSIREAKEELKRCSGTQFDPYIVSEFIAVLEDKEAYDEIYGTSKRKEESGDTEQREQTKVISRPKKRYGKAGGAYLGYLYYGKYITDSEWNILSVNDGFTRITGYTEDDVKKYALTQNDLIFPNELGDYKDIVDNFMQENQEAYLEHRIKRKDGTARYVLCYGRQYYDSVSRSGRSEIVISDIEESMSIQALKNKMKSSNKRNRIMWENRLRKDALTGIYNRDAFKNESQIKLLGDKCRVVMVMCDIDHFKTYNDRYGHTKGDELLMEFARILENAVSGRGFAGRMGGDEFAMMLTFDREMTDKNIRKEVFKIRRRIAAEFDSLEGDITISMGAALAAHCTDSFRELYEMSDKALYKAKEEGRNRIAFI